MLYSPGLIKRVEKEYIRDSADGVVFVEKEDGIRVGTPVEVKSRVSPNTFHRTIDRFNRKKNLTGMPGLDRSANKARFFTVSADDEYLRGIVPESHDLFQILHHAYAYGTDSCFYLIASDSALYYTVLVTFPDELLESYAAVTDWLYEEVLQQFYVPDNEVPEVTPTIIDAFKDKRLKSLKMTTHAFRCYLGLWRTINVKSVKSTHIRYPLPPVARGIPLITSEWNTVKGGGDTITKLDDICQERIGIRTPVTVASGRTLLNTGVVFHRCNQMITSKDPSQYPTLHHWRDAAKHRFSMKQSLTVAIDNLLVRANQNTDIQKAMPFNLANCCPSPAEPSVRRSNRSNKAGAQSKADTPMIRLPCVGAKSGKTPGRGQSINKPCAEFVKICEECDGNYPAKKISRKQPSAGAKSVDDRRPCHVCKRETMWRCFKCRRYLCLEPPKNGLGRDGKTQYPGVFFVRVPKLREDGSIERNANGVVYDVEYGQLTCHHIAHNKRWSQLLENDGNAAVAVSAGDKNAEEEKEETSGKKKRKSSGGGKEKEKEVQKKKKKKAKSKKG